MAMTSTFSMVVMPECPACGRAVDASVTYSLTPQLDKGHTGGTPPPSLFFVGKVVGVRVEHNCTPGNTRAAAAHP